MQTNKSYKTKLLYLSHEDLTGGRQLTGGQQDVKQNGRRGHHGRRSKQYVPTLTRRSTLKKWTRRFNVPTLTRRTVVQMSTRRSDQQTTKRIGCSFSERGQINSLVWIIYEKQIPVVNVFTQDKASINRGGARSNLEANASAKDVLEVVQDNGGPQLRASFYLLKYFQPRKTLSVK